MPDRFFTPVQTGPGAHPASCKTGTLGKERPGRDADPSPPSSAVGHERVELYLYSPYGPYGLYRASVPVQGCTLPLPLPPIFSLPYIYRNAISFSIRLRTGRFGITFYHQLNVQTSCLFTYNTLIKILYMFRALPCSFSGDLRRKLYICSLWYRHSLQVTVLCTG